MGFLRMLLFTDISPVIAKAKTKHIEEADLLPLPADIDPRTVQIPVEEIRWDSARSLLFSNIWAQRRYVIPAYSWYAANVFLSLASPLLVNRFIGIISKGVTPETLPWALTYGILLGFCGFLAGLCLQHYFFRILRAYQVGTNVFNERIFKHSLRLSQNARQKNQLGDVVNHMSSDSDSAADFPLIFADFVVSFFMITAIVIMLFFFLGWSALAALVVLFTLAPMTKFIAKRFTKLEDVMMALRDQRVTLMTQTLNAIRVVKYFAWEKSVSKEVMDIRDKELHNRRRLARAESLASMGYLGVSTLVLFVALVTHALRGQTLDATLIFTCISLFGLLEGPFGDLSNLISRGTGAFVGARRILNYLKQDEVSFGERLLDESGRPSGVEIKDISVTYPGATTPVLKDINIKVRAGASVAIVGPVGSGKSTLLSALLGEIQPDAGTVIFTDIQEAHRSPRLAFVPQEAYIINGSLLENLQFGETVSAEELRRALHNSCLSQDLRQFKGGLRTEIGEKGVNLSGGQKQRVALARASLSRPQIVLLDDPLSAVDEETETLLCERLIFGVWNGITRIVVTHRLAHLAQFDQVVYIENGKIKGQGPFAELLASNAAFAEFYAGHAKSHGDESSATSVAPAEQAAQEAALHKSVEEVEVRVTEDEDREVGAVKATLYKDYLVSLGGDGPYRKWVLGFLALGAAAVAFLPLTQKSWLSYYSNHQNAWPVLTAVGIYGLIGVCVLLGNFANQMFWLSRGIRAAQNMHNKMLGSVLKAPVRFFDSTPVGRILQRFSRDLESVDVYLQWSFSAAVNCALQVLVSIFLIVGVMPIMILVIVPVMYLYYIVQRDYRRPAREVKRYDSIARSPRFAHFKESLQGLVVIRSFNKSSWFMQNFYDRLAHSQRMFFSHYMLNRWFSSRIPLIGGIISMSSAVVVALSAYAGLMNPGTAGLVTLYSLSFWGFLNWGVRMFADIETRMTSIERLKFFANLPAEKDVLKPLGESLPTSWPDRGAIQVDGLQVRYADHLPLVLKGISFNVEAGSRVGIVGRTGSGKSTFFQSLFRFVEAEAGAIRIDGVEIASVPLGRLRESMAIIPQDPTLFLGTIRNNLDRYNKYSDDEVIAALKHAAMWEHVASLPNQLNAVVTESGLNLSQGQRQLLCLARALLTRAKVIVMDEATASVDVQTDVLLQKVIREAFRGVTMLIIAHRLGTIADCDQIVEISNGEVKSVRKPHEWSKQEIEQSLT